MKQLILYCALLLGAYVLPAQSVTQKSITQKDVQFASDAYQAGMLKIKLAEQATTRAKSDSVKLLGRQMVVEQTKANEELKAVARAKNIVLSDSLSREGTRQFNDLSRRTGADFDKAYIQLMIAEHKRVIDLLNRQDMEGSDADLRNWAAMTLPVLKHHLMVSEDLVVDLDNVNKGRSSSSRDKTSTLK